MKPELLLWMLFIAIFIIVFTVDIFVTDHRKGDIKVKSALLWTGVWILTAFLFAAIIGYLMPLQAPIDGRIPNNALDFVTGYLIELSLSVDNLFVFIIVFSRMGIPNKNQPHILKWGIMGAIVFRIAFIFAGVGLLEMFSFMTYVFGAILVITAIKIAMSGEDKFDPERSVIVKMLYKFFSVKGTNETHGFFIMENGKRFVTISFITVCILELLDVVFAIDSIPAVLAITTNSFIAITSNLFAILGLRSMYFALSGLLGAFRFLKYGITFILFFIGIKMISEHWIYISSITSLIVVTSVIMVSIIFSLIFRDKK